MATTVMSTVDRKASERKFYTRYALFLVFLVLLGFGPSFYLRGVVPPYPRPNPTLPPAVLLHGSVFTLWMLAIVAQTQLIAARKHQLHMRLGTLTVLFALLMIPVMYLTAVWQVARANEPPFTDPLTWTIVPLAVILSLPIGLFGSFLFLQVMGLANDVYAQIGLVMLVGLLGKNAILIVEFAVQRRLEGVSLEEAAVEGAKRSSVKFLEPIDRPFLCALKPYTFQQE